MKILLINGPNINMLGLREPEIYGKSTYEDLISYVIEYSLKKEVELTVYQSNYEGDIVEEIQKAYNTQDAIVINPAAYTHTSVAILDALKTVGIPTVEVHISKVSKREDFRKFSYISLYAEKVIEGLGFNGYREGIKYLVENYKD